MRLIYLVISAVLLAGCGSSNERIVDGVTHVELAPPANAEAGWQFDIAPFPVEPGQEVQRCYFFKVPYDVPVFVHHIEVAQTTGTHHMNLFRVRT